MNRRSSMRKGKKSQIEGSWIPGTPAKPIAPKSPAICDDRQENQQGQAHWSRSREFPFVYSPDFEEFVESNRKAPLHDTAKASWKSSTGDLTAGFGNISFTDHLALADAGSVVSTSGRSSPFMSSLCCQHESDRLQSSSTGYLPANQDHRSDVKILKDCTWEIPQYEVSVPCHRSYDLNSLPSIIAVPESGKTVSTIAPATPDKSRKMENKGASDIQNICPSGQMIEKRNNEDGLATKRIDVNEHNCDKELLLPITDASLAAVSTQLEDQNPDKGSDIDLNKTPQQQKQRRRKHRPKVVIEGKPKRTRKAMIPNPTGSKEAPTGKRKYVRKSAHNKSSTPPLVKETEGTADPKAIEPTIKFCRRALNFNSEDQVQKLCTGSSEDQEQKLCMGSSEKLTVTVNQGTEVRVAYDHNLSMNKMVKDYTTLHGRQGPSITAKQTGSPQEQLRVDGQNESYITRNAQETNKQGSISQDMLRTKNHTAPRSPNDSSCSTSASPTEEVQTRGLKRGHSQTIYQAQLTPTNFMGAHYSSLLAYQPILSTDECKRIANIHFPEIYKKKRTEKLTYSIASGMLPSVPRAKNVTRQATSCHQNDGKANPHPSKDNCWNSDSKLNSSTVSPNLSKNTLDKVPIFQCMPVPSLPKKLTKKRTRGHTRVRDFASLNEIICLKEPGFPTDQEPTTYGCIEALVAETQAILARKKRTRKKKSVINSMYSGTKEDQLKQVNIIYGQQFFTRTGGSLEALQKRILIDTLVDHFKHLSINNQSAYQDRHALVPYNMGNHKQYALALYRRDGTIVPFEGAFNPVRNRRPRPKVDLDEETSKVWQLLMENINSEGIDGTDGEKAKWWEEERRVFHGRADSFIARMRLVQGDRRFSQWKGSVLDSVIGVFLTQNVSDHLSSSAFMSLVARFPLKSKSSHRSCHEGTNILVKDPYISVLDPEDTIKWNEKISNQRVCDLNNTESRKDGVVNSSEFFGSSSGGAIPLNNSKCKSLDFCESTTETNPESTLSTSSYHVKQMKTSFIGDERPVDDEILSQNSVVSSQNSTDSPISLTGERIGSCFESNSETEELRLRSKLCNFDCSNSFMEFLQMTIATVSPEAHSQRNNHMSFNNNSGGADDAKNSMGLSIIPPNKLTPNSELLEVERLVEENSVSEQVGLTAEYRSQATVQKKLMASVHGATKFSFKNNHSCEIHETERSDITQLYSKSAGDKKKVAESLASVQNEKMKQNHILYNSSAENSDGTESTSKVDNQKNIENLTAESNIKEHKISVDKSLDVMKSNTPRAKRVRVQKAQEKAYDWDNLRKDAQTNGKQREQTTNTMDSLDWDAVRSADVNEIAYTIKERGMNNVLAERIKAFLNRLVENHGSIDLEWLRDVPPDKAKEYLLSIRGLGLKSVECVRLLTLHHLAFPVDTNVGRIAVRLGWVPLQPLPESLQLHLLEMYPVLESIQKYLWPRLCKLDQRTLYELHYQMITFGKVFCTKSKPNCNACPMRGECRHFASAFASARLALPGPEENSLVSTTESRTKDLGPSVNSLPLPLTQSNQQAESKSESRICEPIIEEPATPEPECTQQAEIDIEDTFYEDPNEIPTIKLNIEEFAQNLQNYMQKNMELQESEMSKALVALTPEAASIPMPKLKNVNQLRTEHQVYELPDSHTLLEGLDKREPDDPCSYLLAIWTPGETANSIQQPERTCNSEEYGKLCNQETCFSCNSIREANSQTVRGTLLIPCRTAMRGSFPLNGTYFQVNEVFADHDSSLNPIDVPRSLIWNLPRRTVYFGTSIPTIFKGLSTEGIQHCFWRGYVCVRGFDQKTRAPRPLMARLHFPASKLNKRKGQSND